MNKPNQPQGSAVTGKSMEAIVALCKRRGFIFQSSEIYGGINGFWDYGPLGVELKRNLKDAWWHDTVCCPPDGLDGNTIEMVGLDSSIIMNPKVWEASGHVVGFNDPMVDDKETKQRFRADQIFGMYLRFRSDEPLEEQLKELVVWANDPTRNPPHGPNLTYVAASEHEAFGAFQEICRNIKNTISPISVTGFDTAFEYNRSHDKKLVIGIVLPVPKEMFIGHLGCVPSPANREIEWLLEQYQKGNIPLKPSSNPKAFALTKLQQFNLMFKTHCGAVESEDSLAYLRPETAQGIFANFRNVTDTSRVKVPFGIAQVGKAFRNEVTPRNFTFRSREFEQMEIEFFIHPDTAKDWYAYWRDTRYHWWQSIGLAGENLTLREHDPDELAHYAKNGVGTSDIEYRFPFTSPGFGELEGVAHRTDFDLRQHAEHSGLRNKLKYFDQEKNERYFPHVIEPSAGVDRGALAILCEAYTPDDSRASKVFMKFHPRIAPIKAAVFPLVNKDGMPEVAEKLYRRLRQDYAIQFDVKQSIGKRYARMDEAGTPFCFTIDGDTLQDQTVTVRHRDTLEQSRIGIDTVTSFLAEHVKKA